MQKVHTIMTAFIITFMTMLFIVLPEQTLYASVRGLQTWFEIVFPSLLPFFIMAELLMMYGIVQAIGVLSEPFMRPLFRVPGISSFAFVVGMASGYPLGAKITASLREKKYISRIEAERLLTFANAASPLFLFGVIAISFFHQKSIGILLALSHYLSNIIVGMLMSLYGKKQTRETQDTLAPHILQRSLQKMHRTRLADKRPFGEKLGDAVQSSVQTLLMIGGFIIIFSVITHLLHTVHFFEKVVEPFVPTQFQAIVTPFFTGLFEITTGTELIAALHTVPIIIKLCTVSFILGFHSLSIQAQVASIISKTDIRFFPYFIGRCIQSICAVIITYIGYEIYFKHVIIPTTSMEVMGHGTMKIILFFQQYGVTFTILMLMCYFLYRFRKFI